MGNLCKRRFKREFKMLILGKEGSGKTKLLYQLKYFRNILTIPTLGFNVEIIDIDDGRILTFDLGKFESGSHEEFYGNTDIVMYVVDSTDDVKLAESRIELKELMNHNDLRNCYLMIISNKQDLQNSLKGSEVVAKLNLKEIEQDWSLFSAVANFSKEDNTKECQEEGLIKDIKNKLLSVLLDITANDEEMLKAAQQVKNYEGVADNSNNLSKTVKAD